jgi:hypothetical protein
MPLTKEQRNGLPPEMFAVPGKRKLPIHDDEHTRLAWDMVDNTKGLTDAERVEARRRIKARAKELGIDTSDWDKRLQHAAVLSLFAMSLELPDIEDHPNRMPFSGVLTRIDTPSDQAVGGSGGKRTYLPHAVAEKALPSLLGMPIDFTPNFDGHDVKRKIGTITAATIEGDALKIEGFFYAADFPQECERIKVEKEALGFSYEIQAQTLPMGRDLLQIVGGTFTGAAVLYKDKAAYQSTSLAARGAEEIDMTKEELEALLAAAMGPINTQIATLGASLEALKASAAAPLQANKDMRERIAPHAARLRDCAASMEAAGIGLHSEHGHVRVLHHMAAHMEAAAARGEVPYIYRDHDWTFRAGADNRSAAIGPLKIEESPAFKELAKQITDLSASIGTQLADLKAAAFKAAEAPARKTVSAESLQLLAKGGIAEAPKDPMTEHAVDKMLEAAGITSTEKRIAAKLQLARDGLMVRAH